MRVILDANVLLGALISPYDLPDDTEVNDPNDAFLLAWPWRVKLTTW